MKDDIIEINLKELLGAEKEPSIQQLTLYIPNKDKAGEEIKGLHTWIKEARKVLTIIGGGSTTMPPADGTWLKKSVDSIKDLKSEDIVWEKTTMIYTYVYPDRLKKNLKLLREFLHRFGYRTNQGEVSIEFAGRFYKIRKYDSK